jgi:hypothetical protein
MWYVLEDTVPANTSYANRRETEIKVSGGILHTIYVTIPPGSANLVHCQLKADSYFILPRNEDKSLTGEQVNVDYREWLHLKSAENDLQLVTWNDSKQNSHTVRMIVGVLPKGVLEVEEQYLKTLQMFMRLFRRRT